MKISDLLLEVRLYQNNYIKIGIVEDELKKIFSTSDNVPKINFDDDGMFIILDNFEQNAYEAYKNANANKPSEETAAPEENKDANTSTAIFELTDVGIFNQLNNTKKYYIEYIKIIDKEEPEESTETPPAA